MNESEVLGWWFGSADGRLPHGDGRIVRVGETHEHTGPLEMCNSGLHASERILDALEYAPGPMLYRVRCSGEIVRGGDKLVCSRREYVAGASAADVIDEFGRWCALSVAHLWGPPDVVIYYLLSGDPAAREAARDAACAARAAACAAGAARDAAWAAWAAALDAGAAGAAGDAAWAAALDALDARDAALDARDAQNSVLDTMARKLLGLEDAP